METSTPPVLGKETISRVSCAGASRLLSLHMRTSCQWQLLVKALTDGSNPQIPRLGLKCSLRMTVQESNERRIAGKRKAKSVFLHDKFGRRISDLRISITDRCNYKCVYCRSGNDGAAVSGDADCRLPAYRAHLCQAGDYQGPPYRRRAAVAQGIVEMVGELGRMRTARRQPLDIAITTNGHLLAEIGAAAGRCRSVSRHGIDGRGRCGTLCAHHARAEWLRARCWPEFARRSAPG